MKDSIQQFVQLRDRLVKEKAEIEKRLSQINEALSGLGGPSDTPTSGAAPRPRRAGAGARGAGTTGKKRRVMSPEARARIAEAQRRRWARQRGGG